MNTQRVTQVLAEAQAIKKEIEHLNAELAKRTAILSSEAGTPGRVSTEVGTFTVSENNTYSEDDMLSLLKPGQAQRCMVRRLDKPTVKRLYPAVYLAAKHRNGYKVTIG